MKVEMSMMLYRAQLKRNAREGGRGRERQCRSGKRTAEGWAGDIARFECTTSNDGRGVSRTAHHLVFKAFRDLSVEAEAQQSVLHD